MNITRENLDDLNAVLHLKIEESDYKSEVNKILKDYRKRANIPGFRPGNVPFGMIKKMYGKAVLMDELNKLLSNSLNNYIKENEIPVLGQPIPNEESPQIDLDLQKEFEFKYDLGLAPKFEVELTAKQKFTRYNISIDDALLQKNIDDVAKRFGNMETVDIVEDGDMLQGEFVELDKPEEEAIKHVSTIMLEYIEDEKQKSKFIGLKPGSTIEVDPKKVSKGESDLAAMLGVEKELLPEIGNKFSFTIDKVYRMQPAELTQELFDKIFGPDQVKSEKEFKDKIREELAKNLEVDSGLKLKKDIYDHFISKLKLSLPDDFLKRWIKQSGEEELTEDKLEEEYEKYADSLRWRLIENKIIEKEDLKVEIDEIKGKIRSIINKQFAIYGLPEVDEERIEEMTAEVLQNREEVEKIYGELMDEKIMDKMINTFTIKDKDVTYDEFVKLVTEKPRKFKLFNKLKF